MTTETKNIKKDKKKKGKVKVFTKKSSKPINVEKNIIEDLQAKYEGIDLSTITSFAQLPLSTKTLKGLKESGYLKPTEIQGETIGVSLQGKDILGAAQTGSGKTLAFLIPLLEVLYCNQWTRVDGIGALVITPTRELAYQIFECLSKVGKYHDFSAGLIIGGQGLKFEWKRMDQCNIVICTPGRLLQHMDQNPLFDCTNMQILVLDEADRCLDMGFQTTMNAIIANLPPKRQTLLFSATQTKSVKDLARLSLKDPCYISVHENSKYSTPPGLEQSYIVCELNEKVSVIWSFIRNHLKQKCIVFLSSCKQVKYIYEIFCKLRPGMSVLALYGSLHQQRRMTIYETFCQKTSAILFATDLAARGLDFPHVHWVIQADCPEDTDTYIHRVGRTARFQSGGESLLLLLPSEVAIVDQLEQRKIPISKIEINPTKLQNPVRKMEAFLAKDPTLKDSAQRAFVSYVKSIFLMKDKNIFNVHALQTDSFANSLGLAIPPRIRFLQRLNKASAKKVTPTNKEQFRQHTEEQENSDKTDCDSDNGSSNSDEQQIELETTKSLQFHVSDTDDDSDDGILKVKRKNHDIELPSEKELEQATNSLKNLKKKAISKVALAKKILRKKIAPNKKIVFDEDGETVLTGTKEKRSQLAQQYENENEGGIDFEKARMVLQEEDKFDKQLFKEKVKIKHKEEKRKMKEKRRQKEEEEKDDFGSSSESEGPDLSWLPDPDKIYGKFKKQDEGDSLHEESYKPINTSEMKTQSLKSQMSKPKRKSKKKKNDIEDTINPKKSRKENIKDKCSSLSVNETEELALMLLKGQ